MAIVAAAALAITPAAGAQARTPGQAHGQPSFISHFHKLATIASTVPGNGDINPYGVAVIATATGNLQRGNVLVSNFNNKNNLQGTGTTIVQVVAERHRSTRSARSTPSTCPGPARAEWA